MNKKEILNYTDKINKQLRKQTQLLLEDAKHLPDVHAVMRIKNRSDGILLLYDRLDLLMKIIV